MPPGPMPVYDVPGLIAVEMHFLYNGEKCMNKYWVNSNLHETSDVHMHLVCNTFKNWWTGELRAHMPTSLQLTEVVGKELVPDGIAVLEATDLPAAGTYGQPQLPNNVTVAVHWGTGRLGRSTHGRTYHIGLPRDAVTDNQLVAGAQGWLSGAYEALRTALDNITVNVEFSVVSFVHAKAWRTTPLVTPITGSALDPVIDSQRRRLPGRGQ